VSHLQARSVVLPDPFPVGLLPSTCDQEVGRPGWYFSFVPSAGEADCAHEAYLLSIVAMFLSFLGRRLSE